MHLSLDTVRTYLSTKTREACSDKNLTAAGVLVPLFEQNDKLRVVLTQRTEEVEHHKGQISFPGGVKDAEDVSLAATALREAQEEIGLAPSDVELLGTLPDFSTPSGFCITPIVGFLKKLPQFSINSAEVSEVFTVPLAFFLDPKNERVEYRIRNGQELAVYFFPYGKFEIWGATAAIIRTFVYDLRNWCEGKKPL